MKTRDEISSAMVKAVESGDKDKAILMLMAIQVDMLADIRELLTYDKDARPGVSGDAGRIVSDMLNARRRFSKAK